MKNLEDLTDEKIELYVNRMKETILKEREKAAKKAAGKPFSLNTKQNNILRYDIFTQFHLANRKTDTRRQKERRQIQGLKLSLTLERKLTECVEKSLDPCVSNPKDSLN